MKRLIFTSLEIKVDIYAWKYHTKWIIFRAWNYKSADAPVFDEKNFEIAKDALFQVILNKRDMHVCVFFFIFVNREGQQRSGLYVVN